MPELPPLPPIASAPVSLILLAHEDAACAQDVVNAWADQLDKLQRDYEVLLIDDGTSDLTAVGAAASKAGPRLRVLGHTVARGPGAALRTGLAAARFPLVVTCPCDRQYRPEDLDLLLKEIDKVQLVSGFRVWQRMPWPLWLAGRLLSALSWLALAHPLDRLPGWLGWEGHAARMQARFLFGVRLRDVHCPFRLYRRSLFRRIPIQSDGPFADVEVLAKANFIGAVMTDVPVPHQPRTGGWWTATKEGRRRTREELWRVLKKPDFGPAHVPEEPEPAIPAPAEGGDKKAAGVPDAAGIPATP
jgi:glycosyltransferase involved in cell wall biosynthesis